MIRYTVSGLSCITSLHPSPEVLSTAGDEFSQIALDREQERTLERKRMQLQRELSRLQETGETPVCNTVKSAYLGFQLENCN